MPCPPVLGFVAPSGTGKTTLLTQLIPMLKAENLHIGIIKHSHHDFEIDRPGKDSFRLRASGASPVMLVSPFRRAVITELRPNSSISLASELAAFPIAGLDLILVEGFRDNAFPKIELHRPSLGKPPFYCQDLDHSIVAVASDEHLSLPNGLRWLDLNDVQAIARYVLNDFLKDYRDRSLLPA